MRTARQAPQGFHLRRLIILLAVPVLAAATLTACGGEQDAATQSLHNFLAAWQHGSIPGHQTQYEQLTSSLGDRTLALQAGEVAIDGDHASAAVTATWTLAPGVRWTYHTTVRLAQVDGHWQVSWSPATVYPGLRQGDRLVLHRGDADRGGILDRSGTPITQPRPVVVVGVEPSRVTSAHQLAAKLGAALKPDGIDTSGLPAKIQAADPHAFVPVVTLRKQRYLEIRSAIHDLPGTVFREQTLILAPTREFARALLGTVGPVTREDIDSHPGVFAVGDTRGHGGLQEHYDKRLRGKPEISVTVAHGTAPSDTGGKAVFHSMAVAGTAVRTTLDQRVQRAADAAVASVPKNAALVAMRISDGSVLAVGNSPGAGMRDIALNAHVAPGSTFKIVSALTLLDNGSVQPDSPAVCPKIATVQGRDFQNEWHDGIPRATFRTDFAQSCNTAFVTLAPKLGPGGLATTARALGIGTKWDLGIPAFTGSVEPGDSPVDQAAAAFGQGRTQVSPIAMAAATAAVARGSWQQPSLVTDPAPSSPAADGPALQRKPVQQLRAMMRQVVTSGTARSLQSVPGGPVSGKTGTAEYGNANPPRSHSWFTGWQGDIAFAVFVEDGGNHASLALPVTERFLRALAG